MLIFCWQSLSCWRFIYLQVKWHKSKVLYADRFDKYLDPNFFQHRVSFLVSHFVELHTSLIIQKWLWISSSVNWVLLNVSTTVYSAQHFLLYSLQCLLSAHLFSDPLVLHLQLLHDGYIPGRPSQYDSHENTPQRLCQVQQGRWPWWNGESGFVLLTLSY